MKAETEAQRAKRLERESKQKAALLKEQARKQGSNYLIYLVVVLTIVYVVDEIASNMNSTMQPDMILDLFHVPNGDTTSAEYTNALSVLSVLSITTMMLMLLTPFYKSLADKYGRKMFLVLNTTIMGIGLFVCMIAPHWAVYILGVVIVQFVQTNDVQVIYIMETAPERHRAKVCNLTKAIALVSVSLIGVFRQMFYDPAVPSSWRKVFLIPALLGIIVGIACNFLVHETPVFVKGRLDYLDMTDEERQAKAEKDKQKSGSAEGGVPAALRYIFGTPQLRNIALAGFMFTIATGITGYYMTILQVAEDSSKITEADVNQILIIFPFVNGVVTFLCGVVSDAIGRKKACIILNAIAVAGILVFVLGATGGWPFWLIAVGYGVFIGTLWSVCDTLCLVMPAESTPTELRASVMGTISLLIGLGMVISTIMLIIALNVVGSANIGYFGLAVTVFFLVVSGILLLRVQETRDSNLYEVGQ